MLDYFVVSRQLRRLIAHIDTDKRVAISQHLAVRLSLDVNTANHKVLVWRRQAQGTAMPVYGPHREDAFWFQGDLASCLPQGMQLDSLEATALEVNKWQEKIKPWAQSTFGLQEASGNNL